MTSSTATVRVTRCTSCGAPRWAGLGPCRECGTSSPEHQAETDRINEARAAAGLPPLNEEDNSG